MFIVALTMLIDSDDLDQLGNVIKSIANLINLTKLSSSTNLGSHSWVN